MISITGDSKLDWSVVSDVVMVELQWSGSVQADVVEVSGGGVVVTTVDVVD